MDKIIAFFTMIFDYVNGILTGFVDTVNVFLTTHQILNQIVFVLPSILITAFSIFIAIGILKAIFSLG